MASFARIAALDLRSLALLRIGLALALLVDLADRARFLTLHYTDRGIFPRAVVEGWSLHLAFGDALGEALLFALAAAFALGLLVGWRARWCAAASFVLLLSLQNRAPSLNEGADVLLRSLLFFALFLPLGARFSVDARPNEHRSPAALAFICALAMVYVFTGLLELQDPSWTTLTAVHDALATTQRATAFGLRLSTHDTRALTAATLLLEIVGPLALFVPIGAARLRVVTVAAFTLFHVATALTLHLGLLPWIAIAGWLALLPPHAWERVRALSSRAPSTRDAPPAPASTSTSTTTVASRRWRARACAWIAAAAALLALTANASAVAGAPLDGEVGALARTITIAPGWVAFMHPVRDGWFVAPGVLRSGDTVDVLRRGAPVSWDAPQVEFPSARWRTLLTGMLTNQRDADLFARNICQTWNRGTEDDDQLTSVDIVFVHAGGTEALAHRVCLVDRRDEDSAAAFEKMGPKP